MRIEQLQYFLMVAQSKSINQASEKLHISQQALSGAIKNLEEELHIALLKRQYAGVVLTQHGQEFVHVAEQILDLLEAFKSSAAGNPPLVSGHILIYALPMVHASALIQKIIPAFCKEHPQVQISLQEASGEAILTALQQKPALDLCRLAFLDQDSAAEYQAVLPNYHFQPLYSGTFLICCSKNSPLAQYKQLSVKTILKYPFVSCVSNGLQETVPYHFIHRYGEPHVVFSTHSEQLYLRAIADDVGIGFVFEGILHDPAYAEVTDHLATIAITENLSCTIGSLAKADALADGVLQALLPYIEQHFAP